MVVTILYRLLKEFIEDHGKLPRRLHLNLGISFSYISLSLSITWGDKIIYFFIFMILIFDQIFWKGTQIKKFTFLFCAHLKPGDSFCSSVNDVNMVCQGKVVLQYILRADHSWSFWSGWGWNYQSLLKMIKNVELKNLKIRLYIWFKYTQSNCEYLELGGLCNTYIVTMLGGLVTAILLISALVDIGSSTPHSIWGNRPYLDILPKYNLLLFSVGSFWNLSLFRPDFVSFLVACAGKLLNWSERSACAALGCWHKRRWPLLVRAECVRCPWLLA